MVPRNLMGKLFTTMHNLFKILTQCLHYVFSSGCVCPAGFEGPRCESLGIGFYGKGYALYPSPQSCMESHMSLEVQTSVDSGLLFYAGPSSINPSPLSVQGKPITK